MLACNASNNILLLVHHIKTEGKLVVPFKQVWLFMMIFSCIINLFACCWCTWYFVFHIYNLHLSVFISQCTHTHTHTHTRTHACTHTHACMHARTCMHTHAHAHTHMSFLRILFCLFALAQTFLPWTQPALMLHVAYMFSPLLGICLLVHPWKTSCRQRTWVYSSLHPISAHGNGPHHLQATWACQWWCRIGNGHLVWLQRQEGCIFSVRKEAHQPWAEPEVAQWVKWP